MRRFSLYKRGRIWYAQLSNPATGKCLSVRPTGESDRRAAEHVADDWARDGLPALDGNTRRPISETFEVSALLDAIRRAPHRPQGRSKTSAPRSGVATGPPRPRKYQRNRALSTEHARRGHGENVGTL
jgi:hypothetical protein